MAAVKPPAPREPGLTARIAGHAIEIVAVLFGFAALFGLLD